MSRRALLCALGAMGQRHLIGLVRAGFEVVGFDPDVDAGTKATARLAQAELPAERFHHTTQLPADAFDVAIFAETTKFRASNVEAFFARGSAQHVLLEKPLATSHEAIDRIRAALARSSARSVHVNFARRTWPQLQRIRALCVESKQVAMTLCGGALGLGCNGIHFLDLFEFLCPGHETRAVLCQLDLAPVASGRGTEYADYGGHFALERGPHRFLGSLSSESSAGSTLTIRGDHFLAWIDAAQGHEIRIRSASSTKPPYLYGQDYIVESTGKLSPPALEAVTERWAAEPSILPTFDEAMGAHRALLDLLQLGGAKGPHRFT
jgi:predicted dehydrogenase